MLTLSFFGSPQYLLNERPISGFASRKAEALLIYLACNERAYARESLATLLWDDRSHEQALANLSVLLSSLRKNLGDYLHITRHEVGLVASSEIDVDTRRFAAQIAAAEKSLRAGQAGSEEAIACLRQAVVLYNADFLSGFALRAASGFEEWLFIERERLQRLAIYALEQMTQIALEQGTLIEGIASAQRLLVLDPLHEPAYRLLMELLTKNGQRSAAISCYQECKRQLHDELDVTPAAATIALYEKIRNQDVAQIATVNQSPLAPPFAPPFVMTAPISPSQSVPLPPPASPRPHNLPTPLTRFVGREKELDELDALLDDQANPLISLIGPGGIGKTRLAIEAARRAADATPPRFSDGVWLIELDSLSAADQVLNAIADALHFQFVDGQRRQQELLAYLQQKQLLLVLDNFEHLLDAAELVQTILEFAPATAVLATSRERLNLPGETIIDVVGLDTPSEGDKPSADKYSRAINQYSAIQLFIDRAQRADHKFRLTPNETPQMIRICQQLDGVPLAIELAAAWVRTLSCGEIATEIAQSIDFLATTARGKETRGTAQRHSSLRAVFEHSWRLLTETEQTALAQLSIFRGGFSRDAAAEVANASLRVLAGLLDKSLLRRVAGNRYAIHPLLGQFSTEKLALQAGMGEATRTRHARYFACFLHQRKDDLESSRQLEALAEMDAERENIRTAYRWALQQRDLAVIDLAMEALLAYLDVRCHGIEAMVTAEQTQQLLESLAATGDGEAQRLLGHTLVHHAMFRAFEYENEVAIQLAQRALLILEEYKSVGGVAFAHNILGLAQMQHGEMENAQANFEQAVSLRKALGKDALVASSLINIAQIAWRRGDFIHSEAVCREALHYARKSGNPWRIAMSLNVLGILAKEMQHFDDAHQFLQESVEAYQAVGNRWGISSIISEKGIIAYQQRSYSVARSHFENSIAIRRDLGNILDRAGDLLWLGKVAEVQEKIDEAEQCYDESLALIGHLDEPARKANALFHLACLRAQQPSADHATVSGQLQQALQLATMSNSQALAEAIAAEIERLEFMQNMHNRE